MITQVPIHFCWICDKFVDITTCKIDEHGRAVHEACYIARIALENSARKGPRPCRGVAHSAGAPITRHGP